MVNHIVARENNFGKLKNPKESNRCWLIIRIQCINMRWLNNFLLKIKNSNDKTKKNATITKTLKFQQFESFENWSLILFDGTRKWRWNVLGPSYVSSKHNARTSWKRQYYSVRNVAVTKYRPIRLKNQFVLRFYTWSTASCVLSWPLENASFQDSRVYGERKKNSNCLVSTFPIQRFWNLISRYNAL